MLLGVAGGMVVVAGGFVAAYFVLGTHSEARAATTTAREPEVQVQPVTVEPPPALAGYLDREVELVTGHGSVKVTWSEIGASIDKTELATTRGGDLAALAAKGSLPLHIDRDKAAKALFEIKAKHDLSPISAYLDLEEKKIHDDRPGQGLDVWASLPRLVAGARQGATKLELAH
ncbi:MAG: hypothetical protein H7138_16810, partial [Myxococcales bacterium]|nr:hypothetical protein [Myxococcales bacterium]